jgi:hypothetical protein
MRLAAPEHAERKVAELDELVDGLRLAAIGGHLGKRERRILNPGGDLRLPQVHNAVGFGIRERAQEHAVDDAENRRVGADADRQREDRHRGEAGMTAQRAQAVADVAREMLDGAGAELVPRSLAHLLYPAEPDHRLPPRFVRRHAGAAVLLGLLLDVEADLVVEPVLDPAPEDQRTQPP